MSKRASIPKQGRDKAELLQSMEELKKGDADWRHGRTFSMVYFGGEEHLALIKEAHDLFFSENALNPMAFKSLRRMELEVVQMTASMLHGGPEAVGTMTSGGTESILMAVKACRDRARKLKPWIKAPEIVAPTTVHVALDKAAHYFGLTLRYAKTGADLRADVDDMRRLVGPNTVMLVASAPQYPHGVVDPIGEIGALAEEKGIPLHVDACIGGFMLPFVEKLGYPVPTFDFRVPGVTSMSADVHKYGLAAKGASIVVYRDMSYLRHQFFVSTDWSGGIYASPSMTGTRPGGPIAAAWAAMMSLGEEGYLDHARRAMSATKKLRDGIGKIPALEVLGDPTMSNVSNASRDKGVSIYAVADQLQDRGYSVDRQQKPECIHVTLTSHHDDKIDGYVADLAEAVEVVRKNPEIKSRGNAAMYGMMAKVPFRGMVKHSVERVMESMYGPDAADDTGEIGGGKNDGPILRALTKYGGVALGVLDKWEDLRSKLSRGSRRS
jgi:glutamate/tyrosine decarboxylase-like PLP-dependent enzyme